MGLAVFSFLLIIAGSAISWGATQIHDSGGESFGLSLTGAGWGIIALMFITFVIIIAALVLRRGGGYGSGM